MSGFVATNSPADKGPIPNDGFFPAIAPADFREATRQDATVTPARLVTVLTAAMDEVNQELAAWRSRQQALGYLRLGEVPATQLNDESVQVTRYRRAVYALAKAALIEHYADFDATRSERTRAEDSPDADTVYRRQARWAIADLQGQARMVSELI